MVIPQAKTLEELNKGTLIHVTIVAEGEKEYVPKRNYGKQFDQPPFNGTYEDDALNCFKQKQFDHTTTKNY